MPTEAPTSVLSSEPHNYSPSGNPSRLLSPVPYDLTLEDPVSDHPSPSELSPSGEPSRLPPPIPNEIPTE